MNTAVSKHKSIIHKQVICPFCSLLCDDLTVKTDNEQLSVVNTHCPKALQGFQQSSPALQPQINGKTVTLEAAIQQATILLKRAKQPLLSGMGTDVAGCRAAMLLAEKSGAIIDHHAGNAIVRNILVLQSNGWIMTTLSELKNRADFILFLGTDTRTQYPRFFERFIFNQSSLFLKKNHSRNLALIGNALKIDSPVNPKQKKPISVACNNTELGDYISTLLGLVRNKNISSETISANKISKLKTIAEQLKNSKYSVIVWSPAAMDFPHAELTIQTACELVRELNRTTRSAGLSLGGDNGAGAFMSVCAWQSGYPLRVNYANKYPVYDPHNFSTQKLLEESAVDLLFWISSFQNEVTMPDCNIPKIILARCSDNPVPDADVFIPVATPGVDHSGNLFRTDSVVSLPLKQLRSSQYPDVAKVITRINQEL